ncbi:MAG: hypothetical protein ACPHCN_06515 [Mycobacterium sp.]
MTIPTANDHRILSGTITERSQGNWTAELVTDSDNNTALSGAVTITVDDQVWTGHMVRSAVDGGRVLSMVAGGAGGWQTTLAARSYVAPSMRTVLQDIATAAGETLSSTVASDVLGAQAPHWTRAEGTAAEALEAVAAKLGTTYRARVLRDGSLWVGEDTWAAYDLDAIELENNGAHRYRVFGPKQLDLQPGVTLNGERVVQVEHRISEDGLRTYAHTLDDTSATTKGAGVFASFKAIVDRILGRRLDMLALYPCRVASQSSSGLLELTPDDARVRGFGLQAVPIRHGLPGFTARVPEGARVRLGWDAGDESRPFALLWDEGDVTSVTFDGGTQAVARVGDEVRVGKILISQTPAPALVVTATAFPATDEGDIAAEAARVAALALPATAFLLDVAAVASEGNEKLLA